MKSKILVIPSLLMVLVASVVQSEPTAMPSESVPAILGLPGLKPYVGFQKETEEIYRLWKAEEKKEAFRKLDDWMDTAKASPYPWVVAASLYYQEGKYKKTRSYAKKAIKKMPQCAEAYYWRGMAFEALKKPLEAANEYQAALVIKKDFTLARQAFDRVLSKLGQN